MHRRLTLRMGSSRQLAPETPITPFFGTQRDSFNSRKKAAVPFLFRLDHFFAVWLAQDADRRLLLIQGKKTH